MLVLSRALGEVISIGDDITLHILELNGSHVKFGVDAPAGCTSIVPRFTRRFATARAPPPLRWQPQSVNPAQSNRCLGTSCLSINWHCSLSGSNTISAWPLVSA